MAKYLVIVESPAKVKTIKKFLGANYEVAASNGHVRDFPKSQFGIDVEHDYEPKYITIRGKGDILANLRKEVKKAEKIYLATDPDREGEAISWHLMEALKLSGKKVYRITFNEITKTAVKESLKHAREIDMNLVDAQQARRMLDRMVGYRISPLLWAKVKRGLSAGRVQSVALRIICDREEEINAFIPEEYWTLDAAFQIPGERKPLIAKYYGEQDTKRILKTEAEVEAVKKDCEKAEFQVSDVKKGERIKKAPLPFTTSTLQQEASKVLNFSTQKTMRLAQQLYEGVDIKGNGTVGIITYLRTDSTRVSEEAENMARSYITEKYGEQYAGEGTVKKGGQKIQDAHEAIRPTDVARTPLEIKESLSRDQFRLYQLIWKRFMASRMTPAKYETTSVKIDGNGHRFTVAASKVIFDGFMSVYTMDDEDKAENRTLAKSIDKDTKLSLKEFDGEQHFTLVITVLFFLPFTKTVMNLLGEGETYYRILWLLPMAVVIAYAGIRLFGKHYRIGFVVLALVLVLTGKSVYNSPYLSKAQNRYHIPNSVIAICNEIMPAEEEERVWAVFPQELIYYVRQYTSEVQMPYGREMLEASWEWNWDTHPIYKIMREDTIDLDALSPLLTEYNCQYLILNKSVPYTGDPQKNGLTKIADIEAYELYRNEAVEIAKKKTAPVTCGNPVA